MSKLSEYFCKHDRGWVLSLLVAACFIYLPFLSNPFVFDDMPFFRGGAAAIYASSWFHFDLRWFPYASLGWTNAVFGNEAPHLYHLGNMLLHIINSILLFYFLRNIVGAVQADGHHSINVIRGAWFGALVFALHPVAVYAVGYVIQRSILMATLFALLMMLSYLRGLLSGEKRWFAFAALAYFLACFSKEHSVLMPAVAGAMGLLIHTTVRAKRHVLWSTWITFFVIAIVVSLRAKGVLGAAYEPMAAQSFTQEGVEESSTLVLHLFSAMAQTGLFFKYLLLWLFPNVAWMSIDMREPFITTWTEWRCWLGFSAFIVYGAVAVRLLLRGGLKGLVGFALLYPWLQFGVELVGIRVQEPFVLYRSYLWMPGLMLLIPVLLLRFPQRSTLLALACMSILLMPLAWNRLWVFGDNYRLWNEAALLLKDKRVAGEDRIYFNRGQALMAAQKWEAAASDFERTVAISPQLESPHLLLGEVYFKAERYPEALTQFDMAIAIKGDDAWAYFYKGVVLKMLHRNDEARSVLEQSCRLNNFPACLLISAPKKGH